ncbi:mitochondrial 54S ribosomal protein YmL41 [Xanthoria calcicola]
MPAPKPSTLGPLQPNRFRPPRGQKRVYLPNFTLTLLRTPFAPPNYATFLTPLHLNKLDLKDYLYNLYGVEVLSVRSYVQQARVRQDKPGARLPKPRR